MRAVSLRSFPSFLTSDRVWWSRHSVRPVLAAPRNGYLRHHRNPLRPEPVKVRVSVLHDGSDFQFGASEQLVHRQAGRILSTHNRSFVLPALVFYQISGRLYLGV